MEKFSEHSDLSTPIEAWLARPTKRTGTNDIPELRAAIGTTLGEMRPENQDRAIIAQFTDPFAPDRSFLACTLCDGMGGMVDGGRCAEIAVGSFIHSLITAPRPISLNSTLTAVHDANDSIFRRYRGRGGTTLTALVFPNSAEAWAITVGDTRLYDFSRSGKVQQLSTDDTIAGELKRLRGANPDSQLEPFSNRLAQFVGIGEGLEPRTYMLDSDSAESNYLLSTDGTRVIDDITLERLVSAAPSLQTLALRLIHLSNWCGGEDNSSVICIASRGARIVPPATGLREPLLEIWDCFAKLDVIVSSVRADHKVAFSSVPSPTTKPQDRPESRLQGAFEKESRSSRATKTKKQRKTDAKNRKSAQHGIPESQPLQKQLKIEIVENPPGYTPSPKVQEKGSAANLSSSRISDTSHSREGRSDPK